jgi:hypothetical protein
MEILYVITGGFIAIFGQVIIELMKYSNSTKLSKKQNLIKWYEEVNKLKFTIVKHNDNKNEWINQIYKIKNNNEKLKIYLNNVAPYVNIEKYKLTIKSFDLINDYIESVQFISANEISETMLDKILEILRRYKMNLEIVRSLIFEEL